MFTVFDRIVISEFIARKEWSTHYHKYKRKVTVFNRIRQKKEVLNSTAVLNLPLHTFSACTDFNDSLIESWCLSCSSVWICTRSNERFFELYLIMRIELTVLSTT